MRAMRSISSVRVTASIGTATSSFTIARSRSCSCRTLTSLACVNNRWQKVSVNATLNLLWQRHQSRETQKSFLTQVRLLGDFYRGGIRQQHPHRNFQTPPCWIDDTDRAIFPLRSPQNLKGRTVKGVKAVEDLDARGFRAQGTVGVGASIRISISSFPLAASHPITPAGFAPETNTSSPRRCYAESFAANSSTLSSRLSKTACSASRDTSNFLPSPRSSLLGYGHSTVKTGWST